MTVVMLSKNDDKSFDLLQKINESELAENPLKEMVAHLVSKFLEFTGGTNENQESLNFTSPYKRKHERAEFTNPDSFMFLDKISVLENDLLCNVLFTVSLQRLGSDSKAEARRLGGRQPPSQARPGVQSFSIGAPHIHQ